MTESFSQMMTNLRSTVLSIDQIGKDVSLFTQDVTSHMQNINEGSNQVAVSTDELAKGSYTMSEDIQSVAMLMNNMSDQFKSVAHTTEQSAIHGKQALDAVQNGQYTLEKTIYHCKRYSRRFTSNKECSYSIFTIYNRN
ncbi:methyl-accepting chemotaxis protein [Lysinibacillus sp. MHQ-1]|nr:methyl-accepting chemotaxis protein [Lysinibacillus sp. MHQ-1]